MILTDFSWLLLSGCLSKKNLVLFSKHKFAASLIVLTLINGLLQIGKYTFRSITGLIFLLQHGSSSFSNEDSDNPYTSSTSDPVKDWMKVIEGNKFSNAFSSLEGFCVTSCWPSGIGSDGMFVFCLGFVFVFCLCVSWLEIV